MYMEGRVFVLHKASYKKFVKTSYRLASMYMVPESLATFTCASFLLNLGKSQIFSNCISSCSVAVF